VSGWQVVVIVTPAFVPCARRHNEISEKNNNSTHTFDFLSAAPNIFRAMSPVIWNGRLRKLLLYSSADERRKPWRRHERPTSKLLNVAAGRLGGRRRN